MFRAYISISIFTPDTAFGMVSGELDVAVIPQVGDFISFELPFEAKLADGASFIPHLRVDERIIVADTERSVLLMLDDITAATTADARHLIEMFGQYPGLVCDIWD